MLIHIKVGMRVKIRKQDETKKHYGVSRNMRNMVGNIYKITEIRNEMVRLNNCFWHIKDLKSVKNVVMPAVKKPILFNPNNLDI